MTMRAASWIALAIAAVLAVWAIVRYRADAPVPAPAPGITATVPDGAASTDGWPSFDGGTFSVRYPSGWSADGAYRYEALGPGTAIPGYRFTVPASLAAGTNLSRDTYFSVETLPAGECVATAFVDAAAQETAVTENGRAWTVVKGGGAGAGNLYDETVYATRTDSACYGLRQLIHSTNIGNYDPGAVEEFDRQALDEAFARFRSSFMPR